MDKAIIMKEWLKTRLVFFACLAVTPAVGGYAVIMMNRLIQLKGVEHLWLIMLLKDNSFVDVLKYLPLAVGIAVGVAQMAPEMAQKRLKLTLHLPCGHGRLVGLMLATGLVELGAVFAAQTAVIAVWDFTILPPELVGRVVLTMLPWYFAGFAGYLFVSAICLEGTRSRRVMLGLLGVAVAMACFLQPAMEAYNGMIPFMLILTVGLLSLSYGSIARFREGRQD